jgi:hypothetical protein
MKNKIKFLFVMAILAMMFTAVSGFGQVPDVCTDTPLTSPDVDSTHPATNFATIGVASNFWGPQPESTSPVIADSPALSMVDNFLNSGSVTLTAVTVCHNATTTLEDNASNYDSLFVADNTAGSVGSYPITYARGVPAIFGYRKDVTDASQLILAPTPVSGNAATISGLTSKDYSVPSITAQWLALADPYYAPYGEAAEDILTPMSTGYLPPAAYTPLFSTIGKTFDAVGKTYGTSYIKSGFVSMGQLCTLKDSITYVEFTNNAYTLIQTASVVDTTNTTAMALYNWIQAQKLAGTWNPFLVSFCYAGV